jgi:hypothetical protein
LLEFLLWSDDTKFDECDLHISNIITLQTKYATLLDEGDELRSKSSMLSACQTCTSLRTKQAEKNARIA